MSEKSKTMLVAGCTGVNGYAVSRYFEQLSEKANGWQLKTLARGDDQYGFNSASHISVDLLDSDAVDAAAEKFSDITHIFYGVLAPSDDPKEEADLNARMFETLLKTVDRVSPNFERVIFLQGGKVYGAHLGVYKSPAKEDDSRHFPPNLYFRHEDFAKAFSAAKDWGWTALRPDIVIGHSVGSAMNMGNLIGVYASLCKELGLDLHFPGSAKAYEILVNTCDSDLVAMAADWAIAQKADGAFNITNGDVFRWKHVWPQIADHFGLKVAEPQPFDMQTRLSAQSEVWSGMVEKYGLEKHDVLDLGQGSFGDFIFNVEADAIFDVNKARRAGFQVMNRDSGQSFIRHFEAMQAAKLIPDFSE
ncbi:MAG: SDR family oxidoreductase [Phormidesmis sp.]